MSTRRDLTGFVLAGGKSTRMGRDKALLDWHGRTLLEHMVELLSCATDRIHVVGRAPLPDRLPGRGPLSGIATALEVTQTDANLIVAVDLPLLTKEFLIYLTSQEKFSRERLIACKIGSGFPLCLLAQRTLLPDIQRRLASDDFSVHGWIRYAHPGVISEGELQAAGFSASLFRNINTESDYMSAL